ncbi:unnamed protein product, partial [Iphiclides podalirius]
MGDTEDYFPRGGKKPTVTYFKPSGNFLGAAEKGERKKQKPKKKLEGDDGYLSDEIVAEEDVSSKNCAMSLNYKIVKEGQILLGRVRQVLETKINISLPCRLLGTVMACYVSEPYNKTLESYVNDQIEEVLDLKKMFRPGQYVAVRILEVKDNYLMLSMMPQHVNSGRPQSELHKGALLQAAVSSVEDHGYVMDIGISNTRAFLPKAATNPEILLDTGALTWCCVKSLESDNSLVTLSNELEALQRAVQRYPTSNLLPATALEFTVDKSLDNGIEGHVFEDTTAYVQRHHVDKVRGKKPKLGQRLRARVLYVMPTRHTPFLTMRNIFETTYPDLEVEQRFKEGAIIEEAQVIKIIARSVIFKLGEGSVGTLSLRRIEVDEELTDEDVVAKSYPIGSSRSVRVLFYNLSEQTYTVSDEESVLRERYFSCADLAVGELVSASVAAVHGERLHLAVGRLSGYVPKTHMSDAGLYVDPKKASTSMLPKKFKVGQQVKARVLSLDREKPSLALTLKPSLLAPDLEVLQSYEDAQLGKVYTGVVVHVRDYLLVGFFGGVVALVARHHIASPPPPAESVADLFHPGQIVNCTILRVDASNKKMSGSLITPAFDPTKKMTKSHKRGIETEDTSMPRKKQKIVEMSAEPGDLKKKQKKKKRDQNDTTEVNEGVDMEEDCKPNEEESEQNDNTDDNENKSRKLKKKKEKAKSSKSDRNSNLDNDELKEVGHGADENKQKKKSKDLEKQTKDMTSENGFDDANDETSKRKKKRKDSESDSEATRVKQEKKRKLKEALETSLVDNKASDESDAIETDIQDDSDQVLTPQDLGLIDLSDCTDAKSCKKRIVALLRAINVKAMRVERVENKIADIEGGGLNARNKKFHTAMHTERLVLAQRMQKLMEVLKTAQEKLKGIGEDEVKDYKKKKEKKQKKIRNDAKEKESKRVDAVTIQEKPKSLDRPRRNKIESLEAVLEVPSVKDFWSIPAEPQPIVAESESSSSEEEEAEKPKKKRKKLTAAEKVAKAREEEERVRVMEKRAAESAEAPHSADHFERALLANPNSSQLWIAYMAFHLQATEIERARAVGQRALKTISFREEQEKMNVWLALLNLEHRFGTKESQQKTLEDALQMNEKYQIHSKLLDIYVETGKSQELAGLVELMLRKYRRQREMYEACGGACFKLGLAEKARQVMQKGLTALDKKEHVALLVRFARLERESGAGERAEALLEHVLAAYPQRVDVCSVYADLLLKGGDVERLRQVMDRMTSQKMPARKMKVLYKKWIEVEEKIGDQEQIEKIKKSAMEYVEKANLQIKMEDEDVPTLSAETFAALQEFYAEQQRRQEILNKLEAENKLNQNIIFEENWQLSQFWYDEETVQKMVRVIDKILPDGGKVALISCPTLFVPLKRQIGGRATVTLLEFDRRFEVHAPDFVFYDYNFPDKLPPEMARAYDLVVADPPFLSEECISKTAQTIELLAKEKVVVCTGAVMRELVGRLMGLKLCQFQPRHRNNLANEFSCYANFDFDAAVSR